MASTRSSRSARTRASVPDQTIDTPPHSSGSNEHPASRGTSPDQAGTPPTSNNHKHDDTSDIITFCRSRSPIRDRPLPASGSTSSLSKSPSHQEKPQEAQAREKQITTITTTTISDDANGIASLGQIPTPTPLDIAPEQPTSDNSSSSATLPKATFVPPPHSSSRPDLGHHSLDTFGHLFPSSPEGHIQIPPTIPKIRGPIRHVHHRPHVQSFRTDCLPLPKQWRGVCHDCYSRICDDCKKQCPGSMLHRECQQHLGDPLCYRVLLSHDWHTCPLHN